MLRQQAERLQQEISNLYLQFPELRGDDEMLRIDTLEGVTDLHELASLIVCAVGDARTLYDGTDLRLAELKARRDRFEMRGEFLRALLLKIMQHAEIKKLELPIATLSVRQGSQQLRGEISDELPDDLCRITREPNKVKIKELLVSGAAVPGFTLSNAPPSLAVHVK